MSSPQQWAAAVQWNGRRRDRLGAGMDAGAGLCFDSVNKWPDRGQFGPGTAGLRSGSEPLSPSRPRESARDAPADDQGGPNIPRGRYLD